MEKENIKFGIESIFHMIRHFEKIHAEDIIKLTSAGYNQKQIDEELRVYGSRFYDLFANNTPKLVYFNKVIISIRVIAYKNS